MLLCLLVFAIVVYGQSSSFTNKVVTLSQGSYSIPTGTYLSYTTQRILSTSASTTTRTPKLVAGTAQATSIAGTRTIGTATSTASEPKNTQPCNNYVEFCNRKYSNITEVCAHNSAFHKRNNAASNQVLGITEQLDYGIRMIQGEVRFSNGTLRACHTSCELLDAGTLESELRTVRAWVETHPYDVVTILMVNSNFVDVKTFVDPIEASGLAQYAYIPHKIPMYRDDWPTLGSMILKDQRVVIFMDYGANQTEVPYILDEFSQMWETPFSPVNPAFPCDVQRPPGLSNRGAEEIMYLANHNLNVKVSIMGSTIYIPNFANITAVNAVHGPLSLGKMANECRQEWGHPPNFLLVDFFNRGNGSVFEVAAKMNGVTYRGDCCSTPSSVSAGPALRSDRRTFVVLASLAALVLVL